MLTREQLETKALNRYRSLVGKLVEVKAVLGFVGYDSDDFRCRGTIVQIQETRDDDVVRWMDDNVIDPYYEVEVVSWGSLGALPPERRPRSCWIYGDSCYLDGRADTSDIVRVLGPVESLVLRAKRLAETTVNRILNRQDCSQDVS